MKINLDEQIKNLPGPCVIFGAGGFIGFNLLEKLLKHRNDIFGVFSEPKKNWRFNKFPPPPLNVVKCNITDRGEIPRLIYRIKPKSIFNLAAYGGYSTQKDIDRIYQTNFNSTYTLIEELKKFGFSAYIHAGSQSEYGLNSSSPSEQDELIPNSHYAVSKTADYYLLKYYGKVEKLPVVHLRFYSIYGPWEEPNRLIPTLIREVKKGRLPPLVDPNISRDFVYVDDVVEAMVMIAATIAVGNRHAYSLHGEAFNICYGKKTTIKELAYLAKKLFKIKSEPKFSSMKNRDWDLKNWYGDPKKIQKVFNWEAKINLEQGLKKFYVDPGGGTPGLDRP
ncbi:NAD-dependent epimerase/dehydratase family protein [Candidatus Roizmanbacteria bacterium]|nr:NAD-dependent epimerase/dehydratase family protein [Candidatus Roizmanbacteria bacterium]